MAGYEENVSPESIWLTQAPTALARELSFYVSEAGHFYANEKYAVKRNFHDSFLLLCTLKGSGHVSTADSEFDLNAGEMTLIDCHFKHSYETLGKSWDFIWIHFHGPCLPAYLKVLALNATCKIHVKDLTHTVSSLNYIMNSFTKGDALSLVKVSDTLSQVLTELIIRSREEESTPMQPLFNEAADYLKAHFNEEISIDELAGRFHISKYHFIRNFKALYGVPPYRYLTSYRLTVAKQRLINTDLSVSEISEECGFGDTSNFIRKFRASTGLTPLQYRKFL